jgi:hypothetical protein
MQRDVSVSGAKKRVAMKPSFAVCCNNANSGQRLPYGARQAVGAAMVSDRQAELDFRNRFLRTMRFWISKSVGVLAKSPQKQASGGEYRNWTLDFSRIRADWRPKWLGLGDRAKRVTSNGVDASCMARSGQGCRPRGVSRLREAQVNVA